MVDLEYGTTDVEVTVETTDAEASYEVSGDSDLVSGENVLTVTVTAADGETTQDYSVVLNVAFSSDTSLAVFQVDGSDVVDTDVVELPAYTTDVEVTVEATDADASVEITGGSDLVAGENVLTVVVTAADGETTQEYSVVLNVALGDNVELASFQVNGSDVVDGDYVDLDPYTTEVEVVAEAVDADASVEISGATDLVVGENTLVVTVTAADGVWQPSQSMGSLLMMEYPLIWILIQLMLRLLRKLPMQRQLSKYLETRILLMVRTP
ncbi:MAG: hypothetical protein EBT65_02660 [Actinobacteria bacterium]|nr:hypothetical protein [Actinomycetota bacterium]